MSVSAEVAGWPREVGTPPGVLRDYAVRWDKHLRYGFVPGVRVNDGFILRARRENGFAYQVKNDGQLSLTEPVWPKEAGKTVKCGSVTLECIGHDRGWDVITASTWTSDQPSRVTFLGAGIIGLITQVFASTTIAVGDTFAIYNDITCQSGRTERRTFMVTVRNE